MHLLDIFCSLNINPPIPNEDKSLSLYYSYFELLKKDLRCEVLNGFD